MRHPRWTTRRIAIGLGIVATTAVLLTLADPGITVDEPLDVRPGRAYLRAAIKHGFGFFRRDVVDRTYADNKEHPPLGRWLLGIASSLGEPVEALLLGGPDPVGIYVVSGRAAPAVVFGLLVAAIAAEAGRRHGRVAAFGAGFALMTMPRVFAHAHLGALDLFIAAAWCLALIRVDSALDSRRPTLAMGVAGLVWGLALLTKIQGWLLPPVALAWSVQRLGPRRALAPMLAWTAVGLAVLLVGWPWLWFDTLARLRAYLGTGVDRVSIRVLYFGQVYADRDVPWHFPWLHFAATVPVGSQVLGVVGLVRAVRDRDARGLLLFGTILAILGLFSSDVPVYDGERLYLLVFPLWALLIGRGVALIWSKCAGRIAREAGLALFVLAQGFGVVAIHPFGLSYYNAFVGGLAGADRLGLELAYWSDAVDRKLLASLAKAASDGDSAALAPTLAPDQGKISTTRALAKRRVILEDEAAAGRSRWVVVSRREAYWTGPVRRLVESGRDRFIAVRSRQGVWLAALLRNSKSVESP